MGTFFFLSADRVSREFRRFAIVLYVIITRNENVNLLAIGSQTWADLSDEIKQIDEYRKLTFYLHVYYTIIECKKRAVDSEVCTDHDDGNSEKCTENRESSMDAFRAFLVRRGAEFSTETEFLPYFALPYVFNPMQHPSFKNLFKVPTPVLVTPSHYTLDSGFKL